MRIAIVISKLDLAQEVQAAVEAAGHECVSCKALAAAAACGACLVFAEYHPRLVESIQQPQLPRRGGSPPVVVLVTIGALAEMHRARAAGAMDVLFSPIDPLEIRAEIEAVQADRDILPSPLAETFRQLRRSALVGESPGFLRCLDELLRAARCDTNVLLLGETGTGKEMFARSIHELSQRRTQPYVPVNCASLAPTLLESEIFGHTRGAFTSATSDRTGWFEAVGAGTLLLDEIGDLKPDLQVKLLRVIEQREFSRVGESKTRKFLGRIVCATTEEKVAEGAFRADLLARISQFRIVIPPLRKRPGDVAHLARHFVQRHARGLPIQIGSSTWSVLEAYRFPRNVRQLESVIEGAVARCAPGTVILPNHLPDEITAPPGPPSESCPGPMIPVRLDLPYAQARDQVLRDADRLLLEHLLRENGNNHVRTAKAAGIDRKTLAARLADSQSRQEEPPDA